MQDTGKFRTNTKDQFYTNPRVAKKCIDTILSLCPDTKTYLWIEPSAGNGAFLNQVPFEKIGLDIDPMAPDIVKKDYLKWTPPSREAVVFGNPPFGRQASLAKAFIAKSHYAKLIAFILPKSFTKPSMFNAFPKKFHLIYSVELEKDSFLINDSPYHVPCVFQIWEKRDSERPEEEKVLPIGFRYVKATEDYHIAFRRVGGLAGKCYDVGEFSVQSHYFIVFDNPKPIQKIMKKINQHIFPSNTVGPRSLSKTETNRVLNEILLQFET
jgi:hypothetical protein